MGSHALKMASDWELVTLRKAEEQRDETQLKRALFSRDADATASLWRKEHGSLRATGRRKAAARHAIGSMPAMNAPGQKHQSRGWNG
jgi:hypothetical protein